MIATDNTTVIAYINKQFGTYFHSLLWLVVDLILWLQTQDIAIWARHILGCLNVIADRLSRPNQPIPSLYLQFRSLEHWRQIMRCPVSRLAGEVGVHVSTVPPTQQSHSEAQDHSGGQGDTHSLLVAITTVVSTRAMPVCGPPTILGCSTT